MVGGGRGDRVVDGGGVGKLGGVAEVIQRAGVADFEEKRPERETLRF